MALLPESATVYACGPGHPDGDGRVIDLWANEALIRENAALTAEGALVAAMRASDTAIRDARCLVIGWGRIGRALTERLVGLGFYGKSPTGIYDESTTLAVMRYQAAAGETVNGVASRALLERIMSQDDITAEYATLTPGCEGPLVAKFQLAMSSIGYYNGIIDGLYDDHLASAVANYCASNGLQAAQSITPALRAEVYDLAKV